MNITTHFVDRIFALGYWIGFKLHRPQRPRPWLWSRLAPMGKLARRHMR